MSADRVIDIIEELKKGKGAALHLINSLPLLMWTANPDGSLDFINSEYYKYTGVPENTALEWSWTKFIHPEDLVKSIEVWKKSLATGQQYEVEQRIKRVADNVYVWHLVRANPLRDINGEIIKWLGTSIDINYQKTIEQTLNNFFHIVSHDLISPVNNLKSLLDLIKKSEDQEKGGLINSLDHSVNKLSNTIFGIINIIKVQNYTSESQRINFQQVMENLKIELKDLIDISQCTIIMDFSKCEQINYIDYYLTSILKNLISNSIKYRSPKRKLRIEISTEKLQSTVLLKYGDNGSGIDLKAAEHKIFKPFQRFTNTSEGTGLGLFLIKQIIEKNGGRIEIDSQIDKGTTFTLLLREF